MKMWQMLLEVSLVRGTCESMTGFKIKLRGLVNINAEMRLK